MDDEVRRERPALSQYRDKLESGDLSDLRFAQELAVRETGELLHRTLDELGVAAADPLRFEVARVARLQRDILEHGGPDLLEDESDLLGEPS